MAQATKQAKAQSKPRMTAREARTFVTYSERNAAIVAEAFEDCGCEAYINVYTYNRWKAQGYQVRKGESSTVVEVIVKASFKVQEKDEDGNDVELTKTYGKKRMMPLFCKHQVDAAQAKIEKVA